MPHIAPTAPPVLDDAEVSRRVTLLAELQAAVEALGVPAVLVRNRRLVLRAQGPWEPSGPTDPNLRIFLPDGTVVATTDGASYQLASGEAHPVNDPRTAAANLRDYLPIQPQEQPR